MGRSNSNTCELFLTYNEIIETCPELKDTLKESDTFEFGKYLYEFTVLIIEEYQNEKK